MVAQIVVCFSDRQTMVCEKMAFDQDSVLLFVRVDDDTLVTYIAPIATVCSVKAF